MERTATRLLMTVEEAAEALAVSRTTIYGLLRNGRLLSVKIGSARRIRVSDLEAMSELLAPDDLGTPQAGSND